MDNCFAAKRFFPSCLFASPCWFLSWQNCLPWLERPDLSFFQTRFVFVLSICFFILNFSLYSIFNEHELTFEFGLKHKAQAPLFYGGDDGNRTHDPLLAGQVLSQLSYTPILGFSVTENWTTNRASFRNESHASKVFVLVYFQTTKITLMIFTFSIERRWSSRTFRYGYLVTT